MKEIKVSFVSIDKMRQSSLIQINISRSKTILLIIWFSKIKVEFLFCFSYCILEAIETFTDKDSDSYDLSHGERLAVILNHEKYKYHRATERIGTHKDCEAIRKSCESLRFKIKQYDDLEV